MSEPASLATLAHGGCVAATCLSGERVVAFPWGVLNPLKWLGTGSSATVGGLWEVAMVALWSAAMWLLQFAFKVIDAFTTPDLSAGGPMAGVFPVTFGLGLFVATVLALLQIGVAAFRRDGASLARVVVGVAQFGAVWVGYVGCAAALVLAAGGLTRGILAALLGVDSFADWSGVPASWPVQVDGVVTATVLGLCSLFLIVPGAIGHLLIMLVREAALMVLVATSPIAAAGLLAEATRAWFWKMLRWFLAATMMAPLSALVLGIGVRIMQGIVAGRGDQTAAAVGMSVVGGMLVLLGAISPLVLFRLLAFVDPGTASGAAMRQTLAANGGLAELLGSRAAAGRPAGGGSGAATATDGQGRAAGEAVADGQTAGRFGQVLAVLGATAARTGKVASAASQIGADVLGSAGVGHQAPYYGMYADPPETLPRAGGAARRGSGRPRGERPAPDSPANRAQPLPDPHPPATREPSPPSRPRGGPRGSAPPTEPAAGGPPEAGGLPEVDGDTR